MRRYNKVIFIMILTLAIGFATVSTTLILTGNLSFVPNVEEFDVFFSKAILDGTNKSKQFISEDKQVITFQIDELRNVGDKSELEYEVTNASKQYDAEVSIECTPTNNEYITITNSMSNEIIKSQSIESGTLKVVLDKASIEDILLELTCELQFFALERNIEGVESCSNVFAPVITGGVENWGYEDITISVLEDGSSISGITNYEYYITESEEAPTSETEATGTTDNEITISENGIKYIYYRTVSNSGCKSEWSNVQKIMIDKTEPTLTLSSSVPASVTKGDSYSIVDSYTTSNISGGSLICNSNLDGVLSTANTSILTTTGNHIISCTVSTNANKSVSKSIQTKITWDPYQITNLVTNGNFNSGSTGWAGYDFSVSGGVATLVGSPTEWVSYFGTTYSIVNSTNYTHNFLLIASAQSPSYAFGVGLGSLAGGGGVYTYKGLVPSVGTYYKTFNILTPSSVSATVGYVGIYKGGATTYQETMYIDYVMAIDLTATFGAGNEPDAAWCSRHITSYFDGTTTIYK